MKVLIVNTYEYTGGASIAAQRLIHSLRKNGVEVKMLVLHKQSTDEQVTSVCNTGFKRLKRTTGFLWERLVIFACNRFNRKDLFKVSLANTGFDISRHPLVCEADVIHLHWINQGFLSLHSLKQLTRLNKPLVWTMHDLWTATGICHYPGSCDLYEQQCHTCPYTGHLRVPDMAKSNFIKKQRIDTVAFHYVGCSQWITEEAKKSGLIGKASFSHIPNPIDLSAFAPQDPQKARMHFQLPADKKLLLFAAANVNDSRKGLNYLIEACQQIKNRYPELASQTEIIVIGKGSDELMRSFPFTIHSLGFLTGEQEIAKVYSCADLFVIPSLEDNLPNTIMESLACGVPVCGFRTGGIPEMIDHQVNGYVATYKDAMDLATGIHWILTHPEYTQLKEAARQKAKNSYNEDVVSRQYINIYSNHYL